jgi:hypothetical protein
MRDLLFTVIMICSVSVSPTALAGAPYEFMQDNSPLTEAELLKAFKGKTHKGYYRFDRNDLPTHTFTETTAKDGYVKHVQGEEVLEGKWRVKDNRICYRYFDIWYQEMCFDIYRVKNCFYHVIRTSGQNRVFEWTARSTPKDEDPNCDAPVA